MTTLTWTDAGYAEAIQVLSARTGLSFRPHSCPALEKGVRHAMARIGSPDLSAYVASLKADARTLDDLIVEVTVGETYFFREPAHFEFIRREILPDTMRSLHGPAVFRAWSAGCASGEEPYSLAMMLAEEGLLNRAHILATDISRAALNKAHEAVYPQWSLRGTGARLALPFLNSRGELYRLDESIRRSVHFEYLNLALDVYPAIVTGTWALNLILCRNVLIYFDADTIAAVARRFYDSLAEGGWLITSSADPPLDKFAPFQVLFTDNGVFYRRKVGTSVAIPACPSPAPAPAKWFAEVAPVAPITWQVGVDVSLDDAPLDSAECDEPAADEQHSTADLHSEAHTALLSGNLERAIELSSTDPSDPIACAIHVQALANVETVAAERVCAAAAARHPLSAELGYLHVVLLIEGDRQAEAIQAVRKLLCLDRSLAIAHFTLGSLLRRQGDATGAGRAFRNCRESCCAQSAEQRVPLSDAETYGSLLRAADDQLRQLGVEYVPCAQGEENGR